MYVMLLPQTERVRAVIEKMGALFSESTAIQRYATNSWHASNEIALTCALKTVA